MINLDNNATTRPSPAVVDAVRQALEEFWSNPSSVHRGGQDARRHLELARQELADLIGAKPRDLIFTSGGTESIDTAVRGILAALPGRGGEPPVIVTTRIEHTAVRDLVEALEKQGLCRVVWAPVNRQGAVVTDGFDALVAGAAMAVVQWANNETGAIQPIDAIAYICRQSHTPLICDGTQWVGKMPASIADDAPAASRCPCDILTFSPHKFHGPKGIGVMWVRRGARVRPVIHGTQELGRRGGTENVPGILGAAAAAKEAAAWLKDPSLAARQRQLRDRFESRVLEGVPTAVVNGPRGEKDRLWNTTNIGFPPLEAEAMVLYLSERGVAVSAGAACSSGSLEPSPVLLAMGVPEPVAHGSLRFSLSKDTTQEEVDAASHLVIEAARALQTS